jgi:hypothetical protein
MRFKKMEQFKKTTMADKDLLAKYLSNKKHRACDYSVGNLILWSNIYNTQYVVVNDMLIIKYVIDETNYFAYPMGTGYLEQSFEWMLTYCKENNLKFKMNSIEPYMFEEIDKLYPGEFEISYIRDNADYIYNIEDLKNLAGKKYHGKKNHVNKFLKSNTDWTYETITADNTNESIEMVKKWCVENGCCEDESKADEICVLIKGLNNREELNMIGGIIRSNGQIVALTLGEKHGDDMFTIHFEKAFAQVEGAYPMINQQFIIHELSDYTYVNREEDLGIMGLRKAKESYRPAFMVEKGILTHKI